MTVPAALLQHAEQHACFAGCFGGDPDVDTCLDPVKPLQPLTVVSCKDCFTRLGVPRSLLPAGTSAQGLADLLTQHLRHRRGFAMGFGGYHARGPGFWLSGVYYSSCGLFLLSGERSRALGSDLDLLQLAFKHGVLVPPDARMTDPKQYAVQTVYVRFVGVAGGVVSRQDLLTAPYCKLQAAPGFQRVTLAEFGPLARKPAAPAAAPAKAAAPAVPKPLKVGDVCPKCGGEYRQRALLNNTFVGCLC